MCMDGLLYVCMSVYCKPCLVSAQGSQRSQIPTNWSASCECYMGVEK